LTINSPTQNGILTGPSPYNGVPVNSCACAACLSDIDPNAKVPFRVINNTSKCVHVQFSASFTINPSEPGSYVNGRYNCQAGGSDYSSGSQAWFFVCIGAGGTVTGSMDHSVKGPVCLNGSQPGAVISNWLYATNCVPPGGDGFCPGTGCPSC
jgi:hypothetical protein